MMATKRVALEDLVTGARYKLDPKGDVWVNDGWAESRYHLVHRESDGKEHHELAALKVIPLGGEPE